MPSKYIISDHQDVHFISFASVQWVDVLSRPLYKDIVIDALRYCQKEKGLILYAYVIMTTHIHLIAAARDGFNLSAILRDLKKFTSKRLYEAVQENPEESRKSWMLWLFRSAGQANPNNKNFQVWQQDNRPIQLSTVEMVRQRLDYLHNNPVEEGIVFEPENYVYSSAGDYSGRKGMLEIEYLF
jgi:REP element-mobilizing transposase RayT